MITDNLDNFTRAYIRAAALQFFNGDMGAAMSAMKNASAKNHMKLCTVDGETFHFFALPWSNACADFFVIRDNPHEAHEILQDDFKLDSDDLENLVYLGSLSFTTKVTK